MSQSIIQNCLCSFMTVSSIVLALFDDAKSSPVIICFVVVVAPFVFYVLRNRYYEFYVPVHVSSRLYDIRNLEADPDLPSSADLAAQDPVYYTPLDELAYVAALARAIRSKLGNPRTTPPSVYEANRRIVRRLVIESMNADGLDQSVITGLVGDVVVQVFIPNERDVVNAQAMGTMLAVQANRSMDAPFWQSFFDFKLFRNVDSVRPSTSN